MCFQEGGDAGSLVGASIAWQTQHADAMEVEDRGAPNYNAQVLFTGFEQLYRFTFRSHFLAAGQPTALLDIGPSQ